MNTLSHKLDILKQQLESFDVSKLNFCDKTLVYDNRLLRLFLLQQGKKTNTPPLVILFSTINKPYILDIGSHTSFIKELKKLNRPLYLIEWQEDAPQNLSLDDLIDIDLHQVIQTVSQRHQASVNLLGICQGGTFALIYSAKYQKHINQLILIGTPIHSQTEDDMVAKLIQDVDLDLLRQNTHIPGPMLTSFFMALRPYSNMLKKYLIAIKKNHSVESQQRFAAMEYWQYDCPKQNAALLADFVQTIYIDNALYQNKLNINQTPIDLSQLKTPVLNLIASQDHIVPVTSSKALKTQLDKSIYQEAMIEAGHIGLFVNENALQSTIKKITNWLT